MSLHILVVDDEPDIRAFLRMLLEDNGYTVETADNGRQGLDKVRLRRPDLITLDVAMPEQSGVRVFRDLRESEQYGDIPIILISGVDERFEHFISSRRQVRPPDAYHHKPVDAAKLLQQVRQLLG